MRAYQINIADTLRNRYNMNDHVDPKFCTEYILRKSKVVRQLAQEELFGVKQPLILLLDLNQVDESCRQLIDAFPKHFAHRFAIKANPTRFKFFFEKK